MLFEKLEHELLALVEDRLINDSEKRELRLLIEGLDQGKKGFLRNRAFAIARDQLKAEPASALDVLNWLQRFVAVMDNSSNADAPIKSTAHFSPGMECRHKLLDLLVMAKKTVDICVFTISDNHLADAIFAAHARGVRVRIVTDNEKAGDKGSDIESLIQRGVNLRIDDSPYHMHHKFMVVDAAVLASGSFNWTSSATLNNEENILVTGEADLVEAYQAKFDELWQTYA